MLTRPSSKGEATDHKQPKTQPPAAKKKNPFAVALGKLGASKGGTARAIVLSARRRVAIARKAAAARWKK